MVLSKSEAKLLIELLNTCNLYGYERTKQKEISELILELIKQSTKHNWKVRGKSSLYETTYICKECGLADLESMDHPYAKPKYGCKGKKE